MRFEAKFFNMHLAFQGKASLLFAAVVLPLVPQPQPQSVVEFVVFCVVLWVAFWLALRVLQFWVLFCSLVLRAICGYSFQNQKSNLRPGSTGSANSLPSLAADMQNGG